MKNIEYDIPIFESKDVADLNLYSEKMAEAIKGQVDKFGNPLVFKEVLQTKNELDLIINPKSGDIYGVIETNKNYVWNGKEWIIYSDTIELDNYYKKEEIDTKLSEVEGNEVFVGNPTEAPETAKIIIEKDDFEGSAGLSKAEVYVGAEEPVAGEKVWLRKGKNLFDNKKSIVVGYYISDTGKLINNTISWYQDMYIDVLPNVQYTVSTTISILRVAFYDSDREFISRVATESNKITFIVPDNCAYVRISGEKSNYDNLQLEQGPSATQYETYIKPQIYVRNSNGVYEEYKEQVTAINKINLNSEFSFASAYQSINPIVEKINNIVHISTIIKYDGTLPNSQINVGNLPSEYCPNTQQVFMCGVGETQYAGWNINRAGYLAIHSNGAIVFRTDSANVSYIFINITYFTN